MFEITTPTRATLVSVTPRTETHGDDRVFAISLGIKITGPNTLLDLLSPTLRESLYMSVPDQEQLPGVEAATPLRRCKVIEEVKVGPSALEGFTISIDHGIDENDPIKLGGCKVDKFRCNPHEGGSIDLFLRVGSNDIDSTEAGLLCSHLSQEIALTLTAPTKSAEAIDGTQEAFDRDHPDAGDMFAQSQSDDDDGAHDEGNGDTPSDEATATLPLTPRSTRTARGRDATKAALAKGASQ